MNKSWRWTLIGLPNLGVVLAEVLDNDLGDENEIEVRNLTDFGFTKGGQAVVKRKPLNAFLAGSMTVQRHVVQLMAKPAPGIVNAAIEHWAVVKVAPASALHKLKGGSGRTRL